MKPGRTGRHYYSPSRPVLRDPGRTGRLRTLIDATQDYQIDALYTPTFQPSLDCINRLYSAGYTATFGNGICSIWSPSLPSSLITLPGHRVNDLYIASPTTESAPTVSTLDGLPRVLPSTPFMHIFKCTYSYSLTNNHHAHLEEEETTKHHRIHKRTHQRTFESTSKYTHVYCFKAHL